MNTPFKAIWGCNRDHIFREGVPERYNINKKRESLCYSGSKGFKRWSGIGKARGRVGVRGRNMSPVFGLLHPLPGDFRSNDVTSWSLPVTKGHVTSFPVT